MPKTGPANIQYALIRPYHHMLCPHLTYVMTTTGSAMAISFLGIYEHTESDCSSSPTFPSCQHKHTLTFLQTRGAHKHIPCGLCSAELHKLHTTWARIHTRARGITYTESGVCKSTSLTRNKHSTLDCMNVPSRWVYWQANLLQLWISLFQILAVCALDLPFLACWGLPEGSGSQGSQGAHEDLESAGKHWKATAYWLARAVSPVLHHGLSNCCLCVCVGLCVFVCVCTCLQHRS